MAINVNTVYTTVLSILNKEQRGYLTPYEFNQIATQVQLEIFEKFFEDYNQYIRMPKTDVDYASRMEHIYEEFQVFINSDSASAVASNVYTQPVENTPSGASEVHRLGSVNYNLGKGSPEIQLVGKRDYTQQILSPLTQPSADFPIGTYTQNQVTVYPASTGTPAVSDVTFNYIRKPKDVVWNFTTGTLGQYIHSTNSPNQDFEISSSQQTDVIIAILKYSGVVIRDPQIVQSASNLEAANEANTKR